MNMQRLLALVLILVSAPSTWGALLAGPKGGRIVTGVAPHLEFFVQADRHVALRFYDAKLQPLAPTQQEITATVEAPAGKAKLTFALHDGVFISNQPLPAGDGYRIVLQVRTDPEAKPKNYRIDFHDHTCGGCQRVEYACTCEDHNESGGHTH